MKRKHCLAAALLALFLMAAAGCTLVKGWLDEGMNRTAEPAGTASASGSGAPAGTATAAPTASKVTVDYEGGVVTAAGVDGAGTQMWKRTFEVVGETELMPYSEAAIDNGAAYLQANYKMVALDLATGDTLWTSTFGGGLCAPIVRDGVVYTCSYYGEPLVALSAADGTTLWTAEEVDESFYWPHSPAFDGDTIVVQFDSAGEDQGKGSAVFDLTGKLVSKAEE